MRILHLPSLRFDVLDEPLHTSPIYWSLGSSISYLGRSERLSHSQSGHVSTFILACRCLWWGGLERDSLVAFAKPSIPAVRIPTSPEQWRHAHVSHDPLNRGDFEASVDVRPPAFRARLHKIGNRELRHVIEPELMYSFVGGIGVKARNVPLIDPTDIATDTNEIGYSLTQRFYMRSTKPQPCRPRTAKPPRLPRAASRMGKLADHPEVFLDPTFGGAIIPGRRNVFDTTLDLTGIAFLTEPRNLSPIISRLLRGDQKSAHRVGPDYDPNGGRLERIMYLPATAGDEHRREWATLFSTRSRTGQRRIPSRASNCNHFSKSGNRTATGFNLAANGGYDFVNGALQYAGVQAVYNWNCCGLSRATGDLRSVRCATKPNISTALPSPISARSAILAVQKPSSTTLHCRPPY